MARAHFVDIEIGQSGLARLLEDRVRYLRWELLIAKPEKVLESKQRGIEFVWEIDNRESHRELSTNSLTGELARFFNSHSVPAEVTRQSFEKLQTSIWEAYRYGEVASFGDNPRVTLQYENPRTGKFSPKTPGI